MRKLCLILALLGAGGPALAAAELPPKLAVTLDGEAQVVFDWSRQACETWDIPDASARAFRDASGTVHLIATHFVNRAAVGPDLDSLRHDCTKIFEGDRQDAPDKFDDRAWLSGFFTEDGQTVYALVHNEFQGHQRPALCPSKTYIRCWRNAVTFALSHDGGRSFRQPAPPSHLIATPPYPYEGDFGRHVGYFAPTNIIRRDGAYFALFSAAAYRDQAWGACLMRTERLDDPASWRAWDGKAFAVRFANPYRDDIGDPARHVCQPVGKGRLMDPLGGIVRHEPSGAYIVVMAGIRQGRSGIYAAASWDLIAWSEPQLVWQAPIRGVGGECPPATHDYPALIDPKSADRNFATVGAQADLYFTAQNLRDCRVGPDRDLLRRSVRIEVEANTP